MTRRALALRDKRRAEREHDYRHGVQTHAT
jgi:hypothetical protein